MMCICPFSLSFQSFKEFQLVTFLMALDCTKIEDLNCKTLVPIVIQPSGKKPPLYWQKFEFKFFDPNIQKNKNYPREISSKKADKINNGKHCTEYITEKIIS